MANEYRVSQFTVEALTNSLGNARVTNYTLEVCYRGTPEARVSNFAVEVLRPVAGTVGGRRRQIIN